MPETGVVSAGVLLGLGLGGFFDGVVFHQLLGWHHLICTTATCNPLAKGGTHSPGNVVSACPPCNRLKADMLPAEFFLRHPWAGSNFILYARAVHRALKRQARRAVSLAYAGARAP